MHHFPVDPTPETLSFYAVYLSSYINPNSTNSYLSGICSQLEAFYPEVRKNRKSVLVSRTMAGCKRRFGTPTKRKLPLCRDDLLLVFNAIGSSHSHDDHLFLTLLLSGFYALLRLGELVFPDTRAHRNYRKISLRHTVQVQTGHYSFFLPSHKGDRFFEGNTILIEKLTSPVDPFAAFLRYLRSRDNLFPLNPELWLNSQGCVPTRNWFLKHFHRFFCKDYAGHSLRSGGATSLAEAGVNPATIQAIGRWSSDTFRIYIRKNPVLLHALVFNQPAHQPSM
jgi:hypothetical protein